MSSDSPDQEQSTKKSKKDDDETSKKSKATLSETELPAGTSKSFETERKKSKNQENNENWGFFPQSMWFWKQDEPQQEVQIKSWSTTSQHSIDNRIEIPQQPTIKSDSQYIWPDALNIQEPQRLVNQPTLDQIIEQRKLRENQLVFAQEFSKNVDYLGDRMSKTKLNILIAQLNKILPTLSEENLDSTKKLTRAKPLKLPSSQQLQRKTSKVSENLTPEEITQREQLRQNQLDEYENLRDQIDLFEKRSSPEEFNSSTATSLENSEHIIDETISKTDLNRLIDLLNQMPNEPKENMTTSLQELIKKKPQILEVIKQAFKNKAEHLSPEEIAHQEKLRQAQLKEIENVQDQIALYADRSVPTNIPIADSNMKKLSDSVIEETISKHKLKKLVMQLNEPQSYEKAASSKLLFRWRTTERLTPEEQARREELRQNQLQEYENLREQIGLFGERKSDVTLQERKESILEKTISKKELNMFINHLKEMPDYLKK